MKILNKPFQETGNYLCTWDMQVKVAEHFQEIRENLPMKQRNAMNDDMLFRCDSLYHVVPEKYRNAIFFLLDDGWDVPYDVNSFEGWAPFGAVVPDEEKFPDYGDTPARKLKTLSDKVKGLGYAGLGLWISPQMAYEKEQATLEEARAYWSERARWCQEAGVRYWKVDWGKHNFTRDYLEMMTECVKECAPDLLIEHAVGQGPILSAVTSPKDPIAMRMKEIFEVSDYFRTYDVAAPFVDVSSLCRLDALLSNADKAYMKAGVKGCINVESSPLIAAALCVNMGIMNGGEDVEAALSWQRVAPPMSIFEADYVKSERKLTDYRYCETRPVDWTDFTNREFAVTAPAITARGTRLPLVEELDEPPFVMVSCHVTTKAYTIATLHRVIDPNNHLIVPADVTIYPECATAPIGVFGYYKTLTAEFSESIPKDAKVYAQCMLDDEAVEITDKVIIAGNKLVLDGKLLRHLGRSKTSYGFDATPAVAIQIALD